MTANPISRFARPRTLLPEPRVLLPERWPRCWRCEKSHAPEGFCLVGWQTQAQQTTVVEPADTICRDQQCPCVSHQGLDWRLLEIYCAEWRTWRLTDTETRLLICLMPPGMKVSSRDLLLRVWGRAWEDELHLLRVNIARIRRKLPAYDFKLVTITARGYRLELLTRPQGRQGCRRASRRVPSTSPGIRVARGT